MAKHAVLVNVFYGIEQLEAYTELKNYCKQNGASLSLNTNQTIQAYASQKFDWIVFLKGTDTLTEPLDNLCDDNFCLIMANSSTSSFQVCEDFLMVNIRHPKASSVLKFLKDLQNLNAHLNEYFLSLPLNSTVDFMKVLPLNKKPTRPVSKHLWREFCVMNMPYLKNISLPELKPKIDPVVNAVFIDFRPMVHAEFIIRNCIVKLGNQCSYTVVCGDENVSQIEDINRDLDGCLKIVQMSLGENSVESYNNLLLSIPFWNALSGEFVLLYQEDSCLFRSNITDFLSFDYIGAPWPIEQQDNKNHVGNGGFSLRRRSKMIEMLEKRPEITLSENTKRYMKNVGLSMPPEDVFFSTALLETGLGTVADFETARKFSQEIVLGNFPLGGHNWWLYGERYLNQHPPFFDRDFLRIFKCAVVTSPFDFTLGGGEKVMSYFAKFFIQLKYIVVFFTISDINTVIKTSQIYFTEEELKFIKFMPYRFISFPNFFENIDVDFHFCLTNCSIPEVKAIGKVSIYQCQFPYDIYNDAKDNFYNNWTVTQRRKAITDYKYALVYSDFVESVLKDTYQTFGVDQHIKILYPPSIPDAVFSSSKKVDATFVMIGRIFPHNRMANNKFFDVAINAFNGIDLPYKLFIIGSVKCPAELSRLKGLVKHKDNVHFLTDVTDEMKYSILEQSKYYIQLTGIHDKLLGNQEHFGITLIEALRHGCVPICFNGGYASYLIKHAVNGYLVDSDIQLHQLLLECLTTCRQEKLEQVNLVPYTKKAFFDSCRTIFSLS